MQDRKTTNHTAGVTDVRNGEPIAWVEKGNDGHYFVSRDTGLRAYLVYARPLAEYNSVIVLINKHIKHIKRVWFVRV